VDVCISFRKSHDHKLARKPASKLINNWLGKTVMVCDDEPSYRAIRESELDYLIAKTPDEAFNAIMRLKNSLNCIVRCANRVKNVYRSIPAKLSLHAGMPCLRIFGEKDCTIVLR
jgi:hypothetical protein